MNVTNKAVPLRPHNTQSPVNESLPKQEERGCMIFGSSLKELREFVKFVKEPVQIFQLVVTNSLPTESSSSAPASSIATEQANLRDRVSVQSSSPPIAPVSAALQIGEQSDAASLKTNECNVFETQTTTLSKKRKLSEDQPTPTVREDSNKRNVTVSVDEEEEEEQVETRTTICVKEEKTLSKKKGKLTAEEQSEKASTHIEKESEKI